jgi:hypothetical protein
LRIRIRPFTIEPFPIASAFRTIGNAAFTLSSRESAAYTPCTNALPKTRATSGPKRRDSIESSDSSSSSGTLRLALFHPSRSTAGTIVLAKGENKKFHACVGMRVSPERPLSGKYKNLFLAASDFREVVII